jgi:hypothetical protein
MLRPYLFAMTDGLPGHLVFILEYHLDLVLCSLSIPSWMISMRRYTAVLILPAFSGFSHLHCTPRADGDPARVVQPAGDHLHA